MGDRGKIELMQAAIEGDSLSNTPLEPMLDRLGSKDMGAHQIIEADMQSEPESIPSFDARELTVGGNLATIRLDNQTYTLRITRQKKLILTK